MTKEKTINFVEWMALTVKSIHYTDTAAMDRAINNLNTNTQDENN